MSTLKQRQTAARRQRARHRQREHARRRDAGRIVLPVEVGEADLEAALYRHGLSEPLAHDRASLVRGLQRLVDAVLHGVR